jgi:hypothetical protein
MEVSRRSATSQQRLYLVAVPATLVAAKCDTIRGQCVRVVHGTRCDTGGVAGISESVVALAGLPGESDE